MRFIRIQMPTTQTEETIEYYRGVKEKNSQASIEEGTSFAKDIENIVKDIPDTWKAYPNTIKGRCDILSMEYGEYQNAVTKEEKLHEIEHVGAAALYLWEALNKA